jgi:ADP-ribosylglycohydrolase/fructose-1,6-bisphosphatase/inositol monophosphatase family enzyme
MHTETWSLDLRAALAVAIVAARAAGDVLLAETRRAEGPSGTLGDCPADALAERLIRDRLTAAFPEHGLRGEELDAEDRAPAAGCPWLWLVDPNDGTSAMQRGFRGAAVSIGLVRGDAPVLGVVLAYDWPDDDGTLFTWAEGCGPVQVNERDAPPLARTGKLSGTDTVLVSHQADRAAAMPAHALAPARYLPVPGIALRLARVAAGHGVAAISLAGPCDFDFAGGHALLRGAGGELVDQNGKVIRYALDRPSDDTSRCFGGPHALAVELSRAPWPSDVQASRGPAPRLDLVWPVAGGRGASAGQLSRAQGALLGQCIGDALGSLVEFQHASDIARKYPRGGPSELVDGGSWDTIAGQCTDDTEMALALARSILAHGQYDAEAAAWAYADWFASRPFDIGNTTRRACGPGAAAAEGARADAMRAAADRESQANGALMRLAPLAVHLAFADDAARDAAVRADAALTHPHPACAATSVLCAHAIAFAIRTGAGAPEVVDEVRRRATQADIPAEVRAWTLAAHPDHGLDMSDQMGWVRLAWTNALATLQLNAAPMDALTHTVRLGGDTDTNAAIAGALLGAVHGRDAWPAAAVDRVLTCRPLEGLPGVFRPRPRTYWPVDALVLAEKLAELGRRAGQ